MPYEEYIPEATAQALVWASRVSTSSPDLKVVMPHVSCLVLENSRLMPLDDPRPSYGVHIVFIPSPDLAS
jgi:hypothetical protein